MIPLYDLFSHRNSNWLNNEDNNVHEDHRIDVIATRAIGQGEEIYTSYNFCTDCKNRAFGYGTPEIFRDYGFVEEMPQRWFFGELDVAFELDKNLNPDGSSSGMIGIKWLMKNREPTDYDLQFFRKELKRLEEVAEEVIEAFEEGYYEYMPEYERDMTWQYYDALRAATTYAIDAALREDKESMCPFGRDTCDLLELYDDFSDEEEDDKLYNSKIKIFFQLKHIEFDINK